MKEEQDCAEEAEDQSSNERYKTWKKNSPLLYDLLIAKSLEWPSLTIDWLPSKQVSSSHSNQKILISSHTNSNKNQLILLNTVLPLEDALLNKSTSDLLLSTSPKITQIAAIAHEGDINIARAMPQRDSIVASKGSTGLVYINDWEKAAQGLQETFALSGHLKEGLGLAWSSLKEGYLASGSDDHNVCVWDINSQKTPLTLSWHSNIVESVSFSEYYVNSLASAGDDRKIILWDLRQSAPSHVIEAHIHEINSVDFNKHDEYLLATASNDKTIAIWDMRNMGKKLLSLEYHQDTVHKVAWAPFSMSILASVSMDRKVVIWDLGRYNSESQDDIPSEVLFCHAGHTARISDFSWNLNDYFLMASVAEDNMLHVWQMAHTLFTNDGIKLGIAEKEVEISN